MGWHWGVYRHHKQKSVYTSRHVNRYFYAYCCGGCLEVPTEIECLPRLGIECSSDGMALILCKAVQLRNLRRESGKTGDQKDRNDGPVTNLLPSHLLRAACLIQSLCAQDVACRGMYIMWAMSTSKHSGIFWGDRAENTSEYPCIPRFCHRGRGRIDCGS